MSIDGIEDLIIEFFVHVVAHKLYQTSLLNGVHCIKIDPSHKIVKKVHNYDLAKLQLLKLLEKYWSNKEGKEQILLVWIIVSLHIFLCTKFIPYYHHNCMGVGFIQ